MGFDISGFIQLAFQCKETLYGDDQYNFYISANNIYHSLLSLLNDFTLSDLNLDSISDSNGKKALIDDITNLSNFVNSKLDLNPFFDFDIENNKIKTNFIRYLKNLKSALLNSSINKDIDLFIYPFSKLFIYYSYIIHILFNFSY